MKKWKCDGCHKEIEVPNKYKPKFCCDGREGNCQCMGIAINKALCNDCKDETEGVGAE
jgi:hypothetical protein